MGKLKVVSNFLYSSINLGKVTYYTNNDINMFLITANENLTLSFTRDLEYNDGSSISWKVLEANTDLEISNGNTVAFKSNIVVTEEEGCGTFTVSGSFDVSGNVLALLDRNILVEHAFKCLFENCTNLLNASNLILPDYVEIGCYEKMFKGCSSLITAPNLEVRHLVTDCYKDIFYGCSSLNIIKCYTIDNISDYFTNDWVYGVSSSGTFYLNYKGLEMWQDEDNESYIPEGWEINNDLNKPYDHEYFTIDILNDGLFTFGPFDETTNGTGMTSYPSDFTIDYKINNDEWITTVIPSECITLNVSAGDKIKFRGTNTTYCYNVGTDPHKKWHITFGQGNGAISTYLNYTKSTAHFNVYGNIMSLLYGDNFIGQTTLTANYVFCALFKNSYVESAEHLELPAMTLLPHCYRAMFSKCINLTISPVLPAPVLVNNCYEYMFEGVQNIQQVTCLAESGFTRDKTSGSVYAFLSDSISNNNTYRIPTTGIFIKNPNVGYSEQGSYNEWSTNNESTNVTYYHGIPDSWTIKDYINE